MSGPELSAEQEEILLALANEHAGSPQPSPVRFGTLAEALNVLETECIRIVRDLGRLGLAAEHDAGPGRSILSGASLTDLGRNVALDLALVKPKGQVDEFAAGLTPMQSAILSVVTEHESRFAGGSPTRTHVRAAIRNTTEAATSIDDVNTAIDGLVGDFLSVFSGREPSYRVTLRGLLASNWGTNSLEIIDGLLRLLRDLHKADPSLFRYSWSTVRRGLGLPRKAANLFYITVTQAGLGSGIFKSEGDDWWATPAELDVILENPSGLSYVRGLCQTTRRPEPRIAGEVQPTMDESTKRTLAELIDRVARLEAKLAQPENPSVRVQEAFDRLELHPAMAGACTKLFRDGHYRSAVLAAGIVLEKYVQNKSGRSDISGAGLMGKVFSVTAPLLAFNHNETQSEKDEQDGLMHLFMGTMRGLRNPRAHGLEEDPPEVALEILCLLSFLARQVDRAQPEVEPSDTEPGEMRL